MGSGEGRIHLAEGASVQLSIQPNGTPFSISLPNGTSVEGDYDLGELEIAEAGIYTFTSENGCTADLEINVIPVTNCEPGSVDRRYSSRFKGTTK